MRTQPIAFFRQVSAGRQAARQDALQLVLICCLGGGAAQGAGPLPVADTVVRPPPAPLYRWTDASGRTVYSDRPPPLGGPATTLPYAPSPPRRPSPPVAPSAGQRPGPLPPGSLQTAQPPSRSQQQVLLEQLAKQIESLQAARGALKEGEAVRNGDERNYQRYLDRVQGLRDAVTRQEGVVEALQDQLRMLGTASLVE